MLLGLCTWSVECKNSHDNCRGPYQDAALCMTVRVLDVKERVVVTRVIRVFDVVRGLALLLMQAHQCSGRAAFCA